MFERLNRWETGLFTLSVIRTQRGKSERNIPLSEVLRRRMRKSLIINILNWFLIV